MYQVSVFTECGDHAENEDSFAVASLLQSQSGCLIVLADGQGGRAGGRRAAELACQTVVRSASQVSEHLLAKPDTWPSLLRTADDAVNEDPVAGFTTLVAMYLSSSVVCGASSGDSAAVVIRENSEAVRLTDRQKKNPPVGCGGAEFVTFSHALEPDGRVILMSDGVWKYVGWDRIYSIVRDQSGEQMIDSLQAAARLPRSGLFQDDFTVVVVEEERYVPGHK